MSPVHWQHWQHAAGVGAWAGCEGAPCRRRHGRSGRRAGGGGRVVLQALPEARANFSGWVRTSDGDSELATRRWRLGVGDSGQVGVSEMATRGWRLGVGDSEARGVRDGQGADAPVTWPKSRPRAARTDSGRCGPAQAPPLRCRARARMRWLFGPARRRFRPRRPGTRTWLARCPGDGLSNDPLQTEYIFA